MLCHVRNNDQTTDRLYFTMSVTVWRHVDKTGPEGNIDALLQHGHGVILLFLPVYVMNGAL